MGQRTRKRKIRQGRRPRSKERAKVKRKGQRGREIKKKRDGTRRCSIGKQDRDGGRKRE